MTLWMCSINSVDASGRASAGSLGSINLTMVLLRAKPTRLERAIRVGIGMQCALTLGMHIKGLQL
jgi:hypothetical protein